MILGGKISSSSKLRLVVPDNSGERVSRERSVDLRGKMHKSSVSNPRDPAAMLGEIASRTTGIQLERDPTVLAKQVEEGEFPLFCIGREVDHSVHIAEICFHEDDLPQTGRFARVEIGWAVREQV